MNFNDNGYAVIKNAVPRDVCKILELEFLLNEKLRSEGLPKQIYGGDFGDGQCKSYSKYAHLTFETLLMLMIPKIEEVVGKKLVPTYSYGRIYRNGDDLFKHTDRESCQYSATITLSKDNVNWPIYMDGSEINLDIGDAAVYLGEKIEHWRDQYNGQEQVQVFLHYVDADGPYAKDLAFDSRPFFGYPQESKKIQNTQKQEQQKSSTEKPWWVDPGNND
jgi:hypothetical protein